MIKAITFDFWNTLYKGPADKRVFVQRAGDFSKVLEEKGLQFSMEKITQAFRNGWQKAFYYQKAYGEDMGPRGHVRHIMEELGVPREEELEEKAYKAYTMTLLRIPPEINDDVLETLPLLTDKYKLAVICNTGATPGEILREIMKKDGIFSFFNFLVFSDEVGFAKPNTRIFRYTLEHLDIENSQAAHIGDDPITDVIGAKRSGMKAVWLAPGQSWTVPEADYHLATVKGLTNLFE